MASELITGFAGAPHVGSDDMGAFQAGILGTGSYVLQTGQQLKATVASANKVTIGTGDLVMNGRHVRMATATDLTIQNGTQGQKRNDLIVCRYSKASDGKETATLTVVKGTATSGTPADPSTNKTSILDGATTSDMPLYRIPITNLSVGTPVQLFKVLTPLGTVGDSVTQLESHVGNILGVRTGTYIGSTNNDGIVYVANPFHSVNVAVMAMMKPNGMTDALGKICTVHFWDVTTSSFALRVRREDTAQWAPNQPVRITWLLIQFE